MATSTVTYTFLNGNYAQAPEVNQNFSDLVSFVNNQVVHVDGSKAMTGALTLPGNPTTNLQAAPKQYVDGACTSTTRPASPSAGQRIFETDTGRELVWNGSSWGEPGAFLLANTLIQPNTGNTASTTFVDWPTGGVASITFTKSATNTRLFFQVMTDGYVSAINTFVNLALSINGTDYPIGAFYFNTAGVHLPIWGQGMVTGIPAGVQTAKLRMKVISGPGAIQCDSFANWTMAVWESF